MSSEHLKHNPNYAGKTFTIEVVENGFVLQSPRNISIERRVYKTFVELIHDLWVDCGLQKRIGDKMELT